MPAERILMSKPDVGELEEQYVLAALRSGWIAPLGPDVDAFEAEMKTRIGVEHAVPLTSGEAVNYMEIESMCNEANFSVLAESLGPTHDDLLLGALNPRGRN